MWLLNYFKFCDVAVRCVRRLTHNPRIFAQIMDKMNELFPDNEFSINPRDLQRLDVLSFHKKMYFWEENDAPVQGKRFYEYLTIANTFKDMLA